MFPQTDHTEVLVLIERVQPDAETDELLDHLDGIEDVMSTHFTFPLTTPRP